MDVLGGAPGVFSARWCGRHGDDDANLRLLLAQIADVDDEHCGARLGASDDPRGGFRPVEEIRKKGVDVREVDKAPFREAVQPVWKNSTQIGRASCRERV